MSAQVYAVRIKLIGLPCWGPVRWCWSRIYSWLANKLNDRPGALGWSWKLVHVREWQKSTFISVTVWVFSTLLVYKLVEQLGQGWKVNAAVSLAVDSIVYLTNKLWVWRKRKVTIAASGSRNFVAWLFFFILNGFFAWLLMSRADMSTLSARGILACYGFVMNPALFLLRDKLIFGQLELKKVLPAIRQTLRRS